MSRENVILIGFMGAGKTSVGQALAKASGRPLLDTDSLIEEEASMTISQIFAVQGEQAFRETESRVIARLLDQTHGAVISTGGGLPLRQENRERLRQLGTVVFLRVKPETVLERLKGDTTRPLLQGGDVEEKVQDLLTYRDPLYEQAAHQVVDVDERTVEEIVRILIETDGSEEDRRVEDRREEAEG